jgi:hypothetical protein
MMSELIERFRYRFELWHREQREGAFGAPSGDSTSERDDAARYGDPKFAVILTESTSRFVVRFVGVYFGGIFIAAQIFRLIAHNVPSAGAGIRIAFLVIAAIWTLGSVSSAVSLSLARKAHRRRNEII